MISKQIALIWEIEKIDVIPNCFRTYDKPGCEAEANGKIESWKRFPSELQMTYSDGTIKQAVEDYRIRGFV